METYHVTESKVDLGELFYTGDKEEDDSTVSGCIFLAYRVVTQKSLEYFLTNRSRLLEDYDPAFGVEAAPGYVYTGDEFFKYFSSTVLNVSLNSWMTLTVLDS